DRAHGQSRIEHGAKLAIVQMAASADDDRLPGADMDGGRTLVGVPVLPEAFQARPGLGIEPRGVARLDSENPAGELPFADDFIHVAVQHEPHALSSSAEFQAPRQAKTAVDPARRADGRRPHPRSLTRRVEARMELSFRVSPVLSRQRARLDVGPSRKLQHGLGHARARYPAAEMGAVDPGKPHVVLELKLPGRRGVVGPATILLPTVVTLPRHAP